MNLWKVANQLPPFEVDDRVIHRDQRRSACFFGRVRELEHNSLTVIVQWNEGITEVVDAEDIEAA